jgi:hypothetical protein
MLPDPALDLLRGPAPLDGELCLLGAGGRPNFYGLRAAMGRRRLERLLARSDVPCLRLVEAFDAPKLSWGELDQVRDVKKAASFLDGIFGNASSNSRCLRQHQRLLQCRVPVFRDLYLSRLQRPRSSAGPSSASRISSGLMPISSGMFRPTRRGPDHAMAPSSSRQPRRARARERVGALPRGHARGFTPFFLRFASTLSANSTAFSRR